MLPFIMIDVQGVKVEALVDTGCQQSVICECLCRQIGITAKGPSLIVEMLNGKSTYCAGEVTVAAVIDRVDMRIRALVAKELVCGVKVIIGVDVIARMGGVYIGPSLEVQFGGSRTCASLAAAKPPLQINDRDFVAIFDGSKWTIEWKWQNGEPNLKNRCAGYPVPTRCLEDFNNEVKQWIKDGWLEEYNPDVHGRQEGIIPLLAVQQPNKEKKVRPVMDYRELNHYVTSHPGADVAVCQEKLRKWRTKSKFAFILEYKGKKFVMTRMGFGLNVAPKIMSRIISTVLSLETRRYREERTITSTIYGWMAVW